MTKALGWLVPGLLLGCGSGSHPNAPRSTPMSVGELPFRLKLCSERPLRLEGAPGVRQSRGCIVTFTQQLTDVATRSRLGVDRLQRRYLAYVPARLPSTPVPVLFVFPGSTANAEAAAFYYTHTRFEELADRDGFIVVYGNGVAEAHGADGQVPMQKGGFFPACLVEHAGEGFDVTYVRMIVSQLETQLHVDRSRIYATGLSQGGGMSFQLALEAPDLVAAIAPVAAVPFQPNGEWLHSCHPQPGYDEVSIAMLAATSDRFVSYSAGGSPLYPNAHYPGMEETRDAWLAALQLQGPPQVDLIPDTIRGDSYSPDTGLATSSVERQRYPTGTNGQELWFYKAVGMGHWWPNPEQIWSGLWPKFGKTNQDVDFADEAWAFFQRHQKRPSAPSVPPPS